VITYDRLIAEYISNHVFSKLTDSDLLAAFELAVTRHDDMELSDGQTNRIVTNMGNLRTHVLARMAKPAS
jgi:hypothetical protein